MLDQRFIANEAVWHTRAVNHYDEDYKYTYQSFPDLFDFDELERQILTGKSTEKQKVSEMEERFEKAKAAREYARKVIKERRRLSGDN